MKFEGKVPNHEEIYIKLRDLILFGELAPGQAVTINGLTTKIGAGMMPVREGVRRLLAQGALESTGTRRVVVPQISYHQLGQIRYMRNLVEPKLASLAAHNADEDLIKKLRDIDSLVNQSLANGNVSKYLEFNYRFHFELYRAAKNDILFDIAQLLWLKIGPSLRVVFGKVGTENLPDMHDEAINFLSKGNDAEVEKAIFQDIAQGMDHIEKELETYRQNQIT